MKPIPCNKKQLASEMSVSMSTLRRLLKKANIAIPRGIISPEKKQEILKILGWREKESTDTK